MAGAAWQQMTAQNALRGPGTPGTRGLGAFQNRTWAGVPPPPPASGFGEGESWFRTLAPTVLTIGAVVGGGWLVWHYVGGRIMGAIDGVERTASSAWSDFTHADYRQVARGVGELSSDVGKAAVGGAAGLVEGVVDSLVRDPYRAATGYTRAVEAGGGFRDAFSTRVEF